MKKFRLISIMALTALMFTSLGVVGIVSAESATPQEAVTQTYQAGNLVGTKPDYATDTKVNYGKLGDHGKPLNPVGYVDHPAFATVNKTNFPEMEIYKSSEDKPEEDMIRAKNIVYTLNIPGLKSADYGRVEITMYWSDWSFNQHNLYVYASGTKTFVDEGGAPVGYVAEVQSKGPQTKMTITVDDSAKLADSEGNINNLFIMYGGNVKDKADTVVGTNIGSQPWINEVNFIVRPKVVKSESFQAGKIIGTKPAYVTDEKANYGNLVDYAAKLNPVGYVDHPAFANVNKDKFPGMEIYKSSEDKPEEDMIRAKNIVYTLNIPNLKAEDYGKFELNMFWSDWSFNQHKIYLYGSGTTKFVDENGKPTGYALEVEAKGPQTKILMYLEDVTKLADSEGNIKNLFVMYGGNVKDTADKTVGTAIGSQPWINDINFTTWEDIPADSKKLEAGLYVGPKPDYVTDDKVTVVPMRDHGKKYDVYGYVDHPAYITIDDKALPNAELYNGDKDIRASKVVFPLHFNHIKAQDYAQFQLTMLWTDWSFGEHQFYIYGSGTTKFVNDDGTPAKYVKALKTSGPNTRYKITLDDVNALANKEGMIDDIFIVYWGNTRDAKSETGEIFGTWKGTQIWVNEVNFLLEKDVEKPVISEEFITKDISEVMPVDKGWETTLKSNGIQSGSAGYGAYTLAGAVQSEKFDKFEFTFTPNYAKNFSIDILMHAPDAGTDYTTGGLFFWLSDDNITIGATNHMIKLKSNEYPEGLFTSGTSCKIALSAIPYYLEGVQTGFYLAVNVNDSKDPLLSIMVPNDKANLSNKNNYTKVILQDLGTDYKAVFAPKAENPVKTGAEIMKVVLGTASGKTVYEKARASLEMSHTFVEGETISDMVIEGDATYNKDANALEFGKPGDVTIYYTVTNAFGTFESNKLTLTYKSKDVPPDVKPSESTESKEDDAESFGCKSSIGSGSILTMMLALGGIAAMKLLRKQR